ncbi:hypothetical protein [Streptomyces sp. B29(2018)]|uniref:hypothetical protein n=1 Tax=Streptomyces sp. B29(2018) TaxID=2485016 RepID=UPI0013E2C986|nr:hypothetical protein [Streptomyces sp. B29(2018)]
MTELAITTTQGTAAAQEPCVWILESGEDPDTGDLYVHGGCDWISLTRYAVTTRRQLR